MIKLNAASTHCEKKVLTDQFCVNSVCPYLVLNRYLKNGPLTIRNLVISTQRKKKKYENAEVFREYTCEDPIPHLFIFMIEKVQINLFP